MTLLKENDRNSFKGEEYSSTEFKNSNSNEHLKHSESFSTKCSTLENNLSDPSLDQIKSIKFSESHYQSPKMPNWVQYSVLMIVTTFVLPDYYLYDLPQAIQSPLNEQVGINPEQISLLYFVYGIPNTCLALFGGLFIQIYGDKKAMALFISLIAIGQTIFSVGVVYESYTGMLIGRTIFGLGGENFITGQMFILEKWFSGKMLSIAFGFGLVFNLLGTFANNFLTPYTYIASQNSLGAVCGLSLMFVLYSVIGVIAYCILDYKYSYILNSSDQVSKKPKEDQSEVVSENSGLEKFKLSDLKKMNPIFWLLCLAQLVVSNIYYQFMNFGTTYNQVRFNQSYSDSKNYMSLIPLLTVPFILCFSSCIEAYGKKAQVLFVASILSILSPVWLYCLPSDSGMWLLFPYINISLWFSMYSAAIWSSYSAIAPKNMMGIAFGLANVFNNTGLALFPLLFGAINIDNKAESYDRSMLVLLVFSVLGFCIMFTVWVLNMKQDRILDRVDKKTDENQKNSERNELADGKITSDPLKQDLINNNDN